MNTDETYCLKQREASTPDTWRTEAKETGAVQNCQAQCSCDRERPGPGALGRLQLRGDQGRLLLSFYINSTKFRYFPESGDFVFPEALALGPH